MILGIDKDNIKVPIENYADKLVWYMEYFMDMLQFETQCISEKTNEKAQIGLKWVIFQNNKGYKKELQNIKNNVGNKTWHMISKYTKCIMQLVGRLAECVVMDHCCKDSNVNKVCINIAKFRPHIFEDYSDIDYEKYIAFSPSFKYYIYKDKNSGLYKKDPIVPDYYNPKHTSMDISWCERENYLSQLKVDLPKTEYLDNAKLQIKATLNCNKLKLGEKYFLTPVLCLNFDDDFDKLKNKYPDNIIYSVRELFPDMYREMEIYFKTLAAYAIGMIDHININETEICENNKLAELFRTPMRNLWKEENLNIESVIKIAKEYNKPTIIGV